MTPDTFAAALEKLAVTRQLDASKFFGVSQSRISEYRSGKKKIPAYIKASVEAHLLLSEENLQQIKQLRDI